MKSKMIHTMTALLGIASLATAEVPTMIAYQGNMNDAVGKPFHGAAEFKFTLANADGSMSFWQNDSSYPSSAGEPVTAVTVDLDHGLYTIMLGDPGAGMEPIDPATLAGNELYLRVWFRDPASPASTFSRLAPDMRIVSVPYAFVAQKVCDGAVSTNGIANRSITSEKIASGAVTSAELSESLWLGFPGLAGSDSQAGSLSLFSDDPSVSGVSIALFGSSGMVSAQGGFQIPGRAELFPQSWGSRLRLFDEEGLEAARLGSTEPNGGILKLYQYTDPAHLDAFASEGLIAMGSQSGGTSGAYMELRQGDGTSGIELDGENGDGGGRILLRKGDGEIGINIDGDDDGAGYVSIRNLAGNPVIKLDGNDADGYGRITTQVLEITGGADLSELFEVSETHGGIDPGSVVCIDPLNPGQLRLSDSAGDPTVAGIISGAGGVRTGMLMGQAGSIAGGQHAVALSGRVYCRVDADEGGAVKPGDFLTTSSIPGHAMAADPAKCSGRIVGKAMTGLESGRGLVLVLVNLQ